MTINGPIDTQGRKFDRQKIRYVKKIYQKWAFSLFLQNFVIAIETKKFFWFDSSGTNHKFFVLIWLEIDFYNWPDKDSKNQWFLLNFSVNVFKMALFSNKLTKIPKFIWQTTSLNAIEGFFMPVFVTFDAKILQKGMFNHFCLASKFFGKHWNFLSFFDRLG